MTCCPNQQQEQFFQWFARMGVCRFDIQLRVPAPALDTAPSREGWRWLKPSLNVGIGAYFLKYASWVRFMNNKGGDIYIRPHGDIPQGIVFLDDLPIDKAIQVSKKYASCVVCTSENNTQVWLATDRKLSKDERKSVQSWMRSVGYTDPGSVSGDHLGRLCGVRSQKRNCWVNLLTTTFGQRYSPNIEQPLSSPLGEACVSPSPSPRFSGATRSERSTSDSEREFGWAMAALKHGVPMIDVINQLSVRARERGKRRPDDYAKRTVMGAYRVLHSTSG